MLVRTSGVPSTSISSWLTFKWMGILESLAFQTVSSTGFFRFLVIPWVDLQFDRGCRDFCGFAKLSVI